MTTGIYAAHRENQREWILEVAQSLFTQHGIEGVTLAEIAKAARLTKATLYRYFSSKEEMAQEIFKIVTRGWRERNEREVWSISGNGYAYIERFVTSHFNYLFQNSHEARFVAEFNYKYAQAWSAALMTALLLENLSEERQRLLDAIYAGQKDGSLRPDIAPEVMLAVIFNFNSGMLSRVGEMGDKLEGEYGLSLEAIFSQVARIFLDGLRPGPNQSPSRKEE
jgi:AcrR family transcriptional regulator